MSIPTDYAGVHFRSRLEARWAAFFDLVGWRWDYEPIDLDGYIPDFVIAFRAGPMLVEVKPAWTVDELHAAAAKVDRSGWRRAALIVGASVDLIALHGEAMYGDQAIGLINETFWCDESGEPFWCWGAAHPFICSECGLRSVCHAEQSYACRLCGGSDGDHHLNPWRPEEIEASWREAGNRVQWRRP